MITGMKKIYLVRHGSTAFNDASDIKMRGCIDIDLNEKGIN